MTEKIVFSSTIPRPAEEVFNWHLRPGALERMFPPWKKIKLLSQEGGPDVPGSKLIFQVKVGPIWKKWVIAHENFTSGTQFSDVQLEGPFTSYEHIHRVKQLDENSCTLEDEIHFAIPLFQQKMKKEFARLLTWRHDTLKQDLLTYAKFPQKPLRILLSGSGGFVGSPLANFLSAGGHEVVPLLRRNDGEEGVYWDPNTGEVKKEDFEDFDAVIHLAGKNIAAKRWSKKVKEELFLSRCRDTWLLSQVLFRLYRPPQVFICASAVGIYGNRGKEVLTEESSLGKGFLADLAQKWEEATKPIAERGCRVVNTRFGSILHPQGGMLEKLLPLFKLGLGAKIGSGQQIFPWIALDDVLYAIYHCLMNSELTGPVNLVAPQSITQETFVKTTAKALARPAFLSIPASAARLAFGEMANELLLTSTNAQPKKLLENGYAFRFTDLAEYLKDYL